MTRSTAGIEPRLGRTLGALSVPSPSPSLLGKPFYVSISETIIAEIIETSRLDCAFSVLGGDQRIGDIETIILGASISRWLGPKVVMVEIVLISGAGVDICSSRGIKGSAKMRKYRMKPWW
jgi:hypothetical protein